jgi:phage terminase Nu1 subunit (DNA packaging protein)
MSEPNRNELAAESRKTAAESEVGTKVMARVLGVDERTIQNCANEGMPKAARGKFPLGAAVRWYVEREREKARGAKGLNDLDLARQRHEIAKARIAELDLAEKEGAVVPIDLHREELTARLETVAGAVKAIGRYQPDVKAAVTDEAADALLDRMADEILAELHGLKDEIE